MSPIGDVLVNEGQARTCHIARPRALILQRRVYLQRYDHITFPSEAEAQHAFMRLWREVKFLESSTGVELAVVRCLAARR